MAGPDRRSRRLPAGCDKRVRWWGKFQNTEILPTPFPEKHKTPNLENTKSRFAVLLFQNWVHRNFAKSGEIPQNSLSTGYPHVDNLSTRYPQVVHTLRKTCANVDNLSTPVQNLWIRLCTDLCTPVENLWIKLCTDLCTGVHNPCGFAVTILLPLEPCKNWKLAAGRDRVAVGTDAPNRQEIQTWHA